MLSKLIHVNMIETAGERQASLLLPGIENFVALRAVDVYCSSLDGQPVRNDPVGYIQQIIRDCGSLAIVQLAVDERYWDLITGSFSSERPMITGDDLEQFAASVTARRSQLMDQCAGTQLARACAINDVADLPSALDRDLFTIGTPTALMGSLHAWISNRAHNNLSATFPTIFGLDYSSLDHAQLTSFRDLWNGSAETDPIRVTARLWELYRMQILQNAL